MSDLPPSKEQLSGVEIDHAIMVDNLAKPGDQIILSLDPDMAHLLHMAVGVCGEAGELIDAIKKTAIYGKPLDMANVVEELGDLEFYIQGIRSKLNITREQTLFANINKLGKRYHTGSYSDSHAQERADKK